MWINSPPANTYSGYVSGFSHNMAVNSDSLTLPNLTAPEKKDYFFFQRKSCFVLLYPTTDIIFVCTGQKSEMISVTFSL